MLPLFQSWFLTSVQNYITAADATYAELQTSSASSISSVHAILYKIIHPQQVHSMHDKSTSSMTNPQLVAQPIHNKSYKWSSGLRANGYVLGFTFYSWMTDCKYKPLFVLCVNLDLDTCWGNDETANSHRSRVDFRRHRQLPQVQRGRRKRPADDCNIHSIIELEAT